MLFDFFSAAFPWILLGLFVAFVCAYLGKKRLNTCLLELLREDIAQVDGPDLPGLLVYEAASSVLVLSLIMSRTLRLLFQKTEPNGNQDAVLGNHP